MTDVTDEMIERGLACYSEGGCAGLDEAERREVVSSILEAALSGTREAVEPVAWIVGSGDRERWRTWASGSPEWTTDRMQATRFARREDAEAVHREDEDAWRVEPLAAPPSDPVGQGAVTVKPLEWQHNGNEFYVYCPVTDTRWTACNDDQRSKADERRRNLILSALSPAPEAGSDEVERMDALSPPDHILDQVQEAMDERAAMGCKVFVSDVLDELRRALSDAAKGGQ